MAVQEKMPWVNPGDCLLACQAARLGGAYKANPKLNFSVEFNVLSKKPSSRDPNFDSTDIVRRFWMDSWHFADAYLHHEY